MSAAVTERKRTRRRPARIDRRREPVPLIGLVLLCVFLSLTTTTFLSVRNALNILDQITVHRHHGGWA